MQAPLPSSSTRRRAVWTLTPLLIAAVAAGSQADSPGVDLARYHNRNRLLFVFAPSASDSRYVQQKSKFDGKAGQKEAEGKAAGFKERDLIRFDVFESGVSHRGNTALSPGEASALRHRFEVSKGQFKVLLVGKDGHTAYSASHTVSSGQLFDLIDAMPMRRDEMHRQQKTANSATVEPAESSKKEAAKDEKRDVKKEGKQVALPNRPDKRLTPDQVVKLQMEALQHNDNPKPDSGIATTFLFASPENKAATGPLAHFAEIVKSEAYLPMLNCKSVTYDPVLIKGDEAEQRVHIVAADDTHIAYVFRLSRQTDGPFAGCWMNDGCVREQSTAPLLRNDT